MSDLVDYPVRNSEYTAFNFAWIKIATFVILVYYLSEMTSILYNITQFEGDSSVAGSIFSTWLIIDTLIYTLALIILAIQALIWRNTSRDHETRNKAKLAIIMLVAAALFTALYDVLNGLQPELQASHRSDNAASFIFMIITHFLSIILLKQLVASIGRSKNTAAGTSIFYTLFSINPVIRFLLWLVILIFSMEYAPIFIIYAELVMIYLATVVTIGFTIAIWKDARRIRIGYLLASAERDKEVEKETRDLILTDQTLLVTQEKSVFCPKCGIRLDSSASRCSKCGQSLAIA